MHSLRRGTGIPILLIHGFPVDHRILLPLDPTIEENGGWERVYVDLPGMGRTPADPGIDGSDAMLARLAGFVHEAMAGRPFAVVGNSYGGLLARGLVAELGTQVLGLCLLCPVIVADPERRALPVKAVLREDPALLAALPEDDTDDYASMAVVQSPENWRLFQEHVLPGLRAADPVAAATISRRYALSRQPEDGAVPFPGPTLVVTGRQDHVVGYVDALTVAPHYPRATFATLDGAGHNAHLDRPRIVAALVDDWLTEIKGTVDRSATPSGN
ncbi:alpha/beta fold hydrolase [Blastococcus haudaquaticus]|uniref:Pimeloyl-ACP methyl ester carboxylesterase n=1 Tax=Blastococcus haudaquaticus TaxID=1938745 RepID=A0A286H2V3_9ACTN|nr:alpha/beta hydrolase [Blastococcus haudaquaticus]SOE02130.1 Pimeloyl-ACP methyl ester carboxylesterase [Blastococcus haudaquaticus]